MPKPNTGGVTSSPGNAAPPLIPLFTAGGDLTGSLTNQTALKIRGTTVLTPGGAVTPGNVLTAVTDATADFLPPTGGGGGAPSGPAGGDLYGTYPNPQTGAVNEMSAENAADADPWDHFRAVPGLIFSDQPNVLHFDGTHLWAGSNAHSSIQKVGTPDGAAAFEALATLPGGLASGAMTSDSTHVFVVSEFGERVFAIRKSDAVVVGAGNTGAGFKPISVAVVGDNVYVLSYDETFALPNRVSRFSKASMLASNPTAIAPATTASWGLGTSLCAGSGKVFLANGNHLTELNLTTLASVSDYDTDSWSFIQVHFAFGKVWASTAQPSIVAFDPANVNAGTIGSYPTDIDIVQNLGTVADDGTSIYVIAGDYITSGQVKVLLRINPTLYTFLGYTSLITTVLGGALMPITGGGGYLYAGDPTLDRVYKVAPGEITLVEGPLTLQYEPGDVSFADVGAKTNLVSRRAYQAYTDPNVRGVVNFSSDTEQTGNGAEGNYATMVGGDRHHIQGSFNTILGGSVNSIVGDGLDNFAHWSGMIAGRDNVINGGEGNSGHFNAIVGGESNTIHGGSMACAILGGRYNTIGNNSSNSYIMGHNCSASGQGAGVFGGQSNHSNGLNAVTLGGLQNFVQAEASVALGGVQGGNSLTAIASAVMGNSGFANLACQMVHGAGQHTSPGTVQFYRYIVFGAGFEDIPFELLDFNGGRLSTTNNHAYAVRATCVVNGISRRAMFIHNLLVHNTGGTVVIDNAAVTLSVPNGTGWSVAYGTSTGEITATVTGAVGHGNLWAIITYEVSHIYNF